MILLCDTRQQEGKHAIKNARFQQLGVEVRRTKLYVGDYTLPTNQSVCIDTKKDIQELIGDLCGPQHERFREECLRANESKIKLIILVENKGSCINEKKGIYTPTITDLKDLHTWTNPRLFMWKAGKQLYPNATKGSTLQKVCTTMKKRYGVDFLFCTPEQSADKIIELLAGKETLDNLAVKTNLKDIFM